MDIKKAVTMKKTNTAIIMNRKKVQKVANMVIKKDIKKAPKQPVTITKRTKMNLPKKKNSTIAKIRKAITKNMAANMNSMNRKKVNTRKVIIISLIMIKGTKVKRDIIRKAITMMITKDTKVNMDTINTIHITIITERKVAKKVAAKKDTNQKGINSMKQCARSAFHRFSDM